MKKITIFTPTYNRGYILENAYNSLLNQTSKNFVWLIIDDGSNDDTEMIVSKWINENKIDIRYYKKKNAGKAAAYNYALNLIDTEYFLFSLDSDDVLVSDGIEYLEDKIKNIKNEIGVVALNNVSNQSKKLINIYNSNNLIGKSYSYALSNDLIKTETVILLNTNYAKKFTFPVKDTEKFFTEAYIFYQMDLPMIWSEKILEHATYLDDGLSKNTAKLFVKSPYSWFLYNRLRVEKNKKLIKKIKYTIYMVSFGLLAKQDIISNSKYKLLTIILFPFGILGKNYLIYKSKN